jgi:subtilase family serine protease
MKMMRWFMLAAAVLAATSSWAAPVDRIRTPLDNRVRATMQGNVPPAAQDAIDQGQVDPSLRLSRMTLFFDRSAAQQAELDSLIEQQHDPSSPNYHKWLTPEQYAERFGISQADMAKAAQWLQAQGFTIVEVARGRQSISFSGTAAQAQAAFGAEIHDYVSIEGQRHFALVQDPSLPQALADVTMAVGGLHDFGPKPRGGVRPRFTSSISGNHFLVPDDVATIYHLKPLYDLGFDGTGQTIAVMGQTAIDVSFVNTFRSLSGLPARAPQVVVIPGGVSSFISSGDLGEAFLDVEWPGAIARNATIIYVNSGSSGTVFAALHHAIINDLAPVLSISYGNCENPSFGWPSATLNQIESDLATADAQGQTVVTPSGDEGAADCDLATATSASDGLSVDFPASSPHAVAVGGTMFNEGANASLFWSSANNSFNGSALSNIPEMVWNETSANQGQLAAGGGGKSTLFSKPVWQNGVTPADGQRDVPDISLAAGFIHDAYLICASGQTPTDCTSGYRNSSTNLDAIGGTSAGVPVFAGMVALLNQKMGAAQGNVNPKLYQFAILSPDAFRDITTGDNIVPCKSGSPNCPAGGSFGFSAGVGYDQASGLGSVDAYNLISEIAGGPMPTPTPPDFAVTTSGPSSLTITHGTSTNYQITIAGMNGFANTVIFSCAIPTSLAGVTCTPPAQMAAPYGTATFIITASPTAKLARPGASQTFLAWNWGGGILIAGLLLGAGERSKKRRKLRAMLLGGAVLVVLVVALVGCGGGSSSGTPTPPPTPPPVAESGTIALQATSGLSGTNVHWVSVAVNVN